MMIIKSGGLRHEGRRSYARHADAFIDEVNFVRVTLGPMRRPPDALSLDQLLNLARHTAAERCKLSSDETFAHIGAKPKRLAK
jgi:hypothetical protein